MRMERKELDDRVVWLLGRRAASMTMADSVGTLGVDMRTRAREKTKPSRRATGKKSTISLSVFMETFDSEVEEELSTMAPQTWAEGAWTGKWHTEQRKVCLKQIREVQMCETRDLGIKWPQCVRVDMRYVCPKDVKKMLVQQARSVYWKKRAAKHGYEKLKEGIWLGSGYVAKEKRRKSGLRSIGMLRGSCWLQKRLLDIGWPDESAKPATRRKAQKSTGSTTPQNGTRSIWEISKAFRKWE